MFAKPNLGEGKAKASLILAIIGIVLGALPCAIIAIILGAAAKKQGAGGMAIAGIVLGIIGLVEWVLLFIWLSSSGIF